MALQRHSGRLDPAARPHFYGIAVNWRPKPQALALVGLVAAGAALRFATLGDRSFWVDEGSTVRLMQLSFGGMLHRWYHV